MPLRTLRDVEHQRGCPAQEEGNSIEADEQPPQTHESLQCRAFLPSLGRWLNWPFGRGRKAIGAKVRGPAARLRAHCVGDQSESRGNAGESHYDYGSRYASPGQSLFCIYIRCSHFCSAQITHDGWATTHCEIFGVTRWVARTELSAHGSHRPRPSASRRP
jgi:hypothetical protein